MSFDEFLCIPAEVKSCELLQGWATHICNGEVILMMHRLKYVKSFQSLFEELELPKLRDSDRKISYHIGTWFSEGHLIIVRYNL